MIKQQALNAFHMLMTTGSVSATARAMRLSQPTITRLLKELEAETKLDLMVRRQGRIYPTQIAHELLQTIKVQNDALNAVKRKIDELAGRAQTNIRIAAIPVFAANILPTTLATLKDRDVEYDIRAIENQEVGTFLARHPNFLCITSEIVSDPGVASDIIAEAELMLAIPRDHPLASRPSIALDDLDGISLARGGGAAGVFNQIDEVLTRGGIGPAIRFRSNRSEILYRLVETTGCCAIVEPLGYLGANSDVVALRPLTTSLPIVYRFASLPASQSVTRMRPIMDAIRTVTERKLRDIHIAARLCID